MPATQEPARQEPMEASAPVAKSDAVVTTQPRSEPPPDMDNEISLRGGRMNLGCTCCDGSCSFHKGCC